MSNNLNNNDDLDLDGTRYPREEAARLVQSALRTSRFLVLSNEESGSFLRNYSVDYPDTVPVHTEKGISTVDLLRIHNILSSDLHNLLPLGGVICVPPPSHLLCEVCRIGMKEDNLYNNQGKAVCLSCKLGTDPISTVPTNKKDDSTV